MRQSAQPAHSTQPPHAAEMGVYVHFPYCLAKCPYCDFVSYATEREAIDHRRYADAVIAELASRAGALPPATLRSIFFGGGTPSLWEPAQLGRVIEAVRGTLGQGARDDVEITVECNPTSLDEGRARALADAGVNRLSIGVQSTDDARLRTLGRLHDASGGLRAVREALASGIGRVSADLIFGLPGESPEEARGEALALAELGLDHLSCYQLTIEPGTRFGELAKRGRLPLADDGMVAESFLAIDDALGARGLTHYEISNYARPGHEAQHNLGYWRGEAYLGLGCAAYGFVIEPSGDGARYRNEILPARYVGGWLDGDGGGPAEASREPVDRATHDRERIMLGLRTAEGVDMEGAWTAERERTAGALVSRGRLTRDGHRLRIPRAAWLWADDTAARLF